QVGRGAWGAPSSELHRYAYVEPRKGRHSKCSSNASAVIDSALPDHPTGLAITSSGNVRGQSATRPTPSHFRRGYLVAQIYRLGVLSLYGFAAPPGIFSQAQQVFGVR